MTDIVDRATRSRMMSRIRGRDTKPELVVRRFLHAEGFRFRLHAKHLPGNPDIVLAKHRAVIFVHGCFWHGHTCKLASKPKSNREYWHKKIKGNRERDARNIEALRNLGWSVLVLWECEIRQIDGLESRLAAFMES